MDPAALSGLPGAGGNVDQLKAAHEAQQKNEEKRGELLQKVLDLSAQQRLDTIRLVKPEKVRAIEDRVLQMAGNGQLQSQVNEAMLKQMLESIGGEEASKKPPIQYDRRRYGDSDDEIDLDGL
eukprot:CAMPEP_0174716726 /NCGR_PEP_ID=MMETSP1094-20130205/24504_1 /TAXON_ID=156173 /ORGANISM="Chrysochromulina brevifilum, Strain UTEX LB 985" /LENGTH=122 /DNA_ID=CAMNT_0015916535 /DNA_START=24 /DNA_END=392 /DNA_ORIENTATION=+